MPNAVYDDQDTNQARKEVGDLEKAFRAPAAETSGSDIARQREIDGLNQQLANSPDEIEEPAKTDTPEELGDKESTPDDTVGKGYTENDSKPGRMGSRLKNRFLRSPKVISIFGTGALALGVGGFFAFISLGPLQLVHYANILQNPIKISDNTSNQRLSRFLWAQRSVGKGGAGENVVARTRVNAVEFKMTRTVNARLAKIGVSYTFNDFGRVNGVTIDISKHPDYKSLSDRAAVAKLADDLKISPDQIKAPTRGGTLMKVDPSKLPIKAQRAFFKGQIKTLGEGKVVTALNFRIIGKYLGLPNGWLHPWEKAKARASQTVGNTILNSDKYKKFKEWEEKRAKAKLERSAAAKSKLESIRGKLNTKTTVTAGAALAGQTVVCLVYAAAGEIPDANRAAVVTPAVASAADAIALGSQTQSADDFEDSMASATLDTWADKDGKTPFQAEEINKLQGKSGGTPADEGLVKSFSPDNTAASLQNILNKAVKADSLCSIGGQITGAIIGIGLVALGPGGWAIKAGTALAGAAAGAVAVTAVLKSVNYLFAEKAVDVVAHQGPMGGNIDALGAIEAANITSRASGGIRMSDTQAIAMIDEVNQDSESTFKKQGFIARLFNPYDYRSALGLAIDKTPSTKRGAIASAGRVLSETPKLATLSLLNLFGSHHKAYAQEIKPTIPYYATPSSTWQEQSVQDPYELGNRVADLLDGSKGDELRNHASVCWGNKIEKQGDTWDVTKDKDVNPASAEYQGGNCDDWSPDVMAVSVWIGDVHDADAYLCANGSTDDAGDACDRVGVGSSAASTTTASPSADLTDLLADSSSMNCPDGTTKDLGEQEGWTGGKMVKIKVCGIKGMKNTGNSRLPGDDGDVAVNARIAANWVALFNKAKQDGITLAAISGYRTYSQQEAICRERGCDGTNVALPGYSNHQMGLAIDISGTDVKGSSSTSCKERAIDPNSKVWTWLNNNAAAQGIKQYTKESWHWDPDPTKSGNRCGGDGTIR